MGIAQWPNLTTVDGVLIEQSSDCHDAASNMGTFPYIGHNGTWSCACDASKQEAISSGTSQTAALPLSQMCHSVVDVTTVPGPLSDYPTVSADSEKLKRLSGRFGCVWLSLIHFHAPPLPIVHLPVLRPKE